MAQSVTPAGINPNSRVNPTTERRLERKAVDNVLNSRTWMSRHMGMGGAFNGSTYDVAIKVVDSGLGEFYSGLETFSSQASDTLIELSFAHTAFEQPVVSIMLESFANSGPEQSIDLDVFKMEEAIAETVQALGTAAYGTGSGKQPLGLEALVDDGTNTSTFGGQSRTTYSALNSTVTAFGTLTLAKLATLESAISAAGVETEYPTLHLSTKAIFDFYKRLLQPTVRAEYSSIGYPSLALRGREILRSRAELKGAAGFTALSYDGIPLIADDAATSGVWYMLNERYLKWRGRTIVPAKYAGVLEKTSLSPSKTLEGVASSLKAPSDAGWFYQKMQMMPNQAGMVGRFHVIGQSVGSQPRRQGKGTAITGA